MPRAPTSLVFMKGFAVATRGNTGNKANPGKVFQCIHHDDNINGGTRYRRELESRVQQSPGSKNVTRRRQRNTYTRARGREWRIRCNLKNIGSRGDGNRAYTLYISNGVHTGHELTADPLVYPLHTVGLPEYQILARTAENLSEATVPYSDSRQVLD